MNNGLHDPFKVRAQFSPFRETICDGEHGILCSNRQVFAQQNLLYFEHVDRCVPGNIVVHGRRKHKSPLEGCHPALRDHWAHGSGTA
jgi:hypothetical protein